MFNWHKLGRVFDPRQVGIPWMQDFAQAPSALVLEDRIRVYFASRPPADAAGQFISYMGYADFRRDNLLERLDVSLHWILPLGGRGAFDEFGTNPASVVRNGDEVWMYYAGWTRCESVPFNAAIGLATSRDGGRTFQRAGSGPVLSYSPDEPFVLGSPRIRKYGDTFYLWYVAGKRWLEGDGRAEPVYRIRAATSKDGIHWNKAGEDLIPARLDEDECQASPDVSYFDGMYHMFFSFRHATDFKNKERGYRIGYAHSHDLRSWKRDDATAGIETSAEGWDSEMVSYPNVFSVDGCTYMYYQGNGVGRHGFGLARLKADTAR